MNDPIETASLLPYLDTGGTGFHINVPVTGQKDSTDHESLFPFLVVSDSGPFSRLIEASINTDALSQIEPVFLLTQKDEYPLIKDELRPINNLSIEQDWQQTFLFHSNKNFGSPPLILRDQISKKGNFLQYQPLLFCKYKQIYFQILCPDCGMPLQQCYNDTLLVEYGLLPYSDSLKRYLFCSSCAASKEMPDFYVSTLASNDPGFLKSRFELIKNYSQLKEIKNPDIILPCLGCSGYQECYGDKHLAISRISVFSFYPFYMLMFKADSINALDFIALMSGASYEEIEKQLIVKQQMGRLRRLQALEQIGSNKTRFFFINEDRYFLEVLYLKLSFLGEISETILSGFDTFQFTAPGLSIERIWVKLSEQNGLLPSFWSFKVELLNVIDADIQSLSFPKLSQSNGLHFIGAIWLYTLLVNKTQNISHVYEAIKDIMGKNSANDDVIFNKFLRNGFPQVFSPVNIFWDPGMMTVKQKWHKIWERSLRMAFNWIEGNLQYLMEWSKQNFRQEIDQLRQQIKDNLFPSEPLVTTKELAENDKSISDILIKIMGSWRKDVEAPEDELTATVSLSDVDIPVSEMDTWRKDVETPEDELTATVSPSDKETSLNDIEYQDFEFKKDGGKFQTSAYDLQKDTDFRETIIITPDDKVAEGTIGIGQNEDPDKTVVMIPTDKKITKKKEIVPQADNQLEKTIRPSNYYSGKDRSSPIKPEGDLKKTLILASDRTEKSDESDLPETQIISPLQRESGYRKGKSSQFQDIRSNGPSKPDIPRDKGLMRADQKYEKPDKKELLEETILIQPKKNDSGKTKDNQ